MPHTEFRMICLISELEVSIKQVKVVKHFVALWNSRRTTFILSAT